MKIIGWSKPFVRFIGSASTRRRPRPPRTVRGVCHLVIEDDNGVQQARCGRPYHKHGKFTAFPRRDEMVCLNCMKKFEQAPKLATCQECLGLFERAQMRNCAYCARADLCSNCAALCEQNCAEEAREGE